MLRTASIAITSMPIRVRLAMRFICDPKNLTVASGTLAALSGKDAEIYLQDIGPGAVRNRIYRVASHS